MLANRSIKFFTSSVHRELTGQRVVIDTQTKAEMVQELKANYANTNSIDEKFQLLLLMETLGANLGELGFDDDDVSFLIDELDRDGLTYVKGVSYAAKLITNHRCQPALTMACFAAHELDEHNRFFPDRRASFSRMFFFFNYSFSMQANQAAQLDGAIAFAELGSKLAMRKLIAWYQSGFDDLSIEPDAKKTAYWQERLAGANKQLLDSFHEYFQLELERIVRYERNPPPVPLHETMQSCRDFCLSQGQMQFREMNNSEFFMHLLKPMVDNNNMHAMYFLMVSATSGNFPFNGSYRANLDAQAKQWGQKIVDTFKIPCRITAKAAYLLYTYHYIYHDENDLDTCIRLLKHAHAMGCTKSMSCLVSVYIKNGCIDEALAAMQHVFASQNTQHNIAIIASSAGEIIWDHPSLVCAYIDFVLLHPNYTRSFMQIEQRLESVNEYELCNRWIGIRAFMAVEDLSDLAERTKMALIKDVPVKRLKI